MLGDQGSQERVRLPARKAPLQHGVARKREAEASGQARVLLLRRRSVEVLKDQIAQRVQDLGEHQTRVVQAPGPEESQEA